MPTYIKTGYWDKLPKAPKEYLNLDLLITQIASGITPPSTATDNVGVFYVSKNYTGIGNALVQGYAIPDIYSTNPSYNTQLSKAKMGDENNAYPDPWAARNAAMTAMTAGTITSAVIIVLSGTWTYGSYFVFQNGDSTGNPNINEVSDIQFLDGFNISSLAKHNIFYYFKPNTTLFNLSKFFQIRIVFGQDATDQTWKSGFYGNLNLIIPYGTSQGLSQRCIEIDNARAEFTFESNYTVGNRAWFFIFDYKAITVSIDKFYGDNSTSVVFEGSQTREGDSSPSTLNVNVKSAIFGNLYSPYPLATTNVINSNMRPVYQLSGTINTTRKKQKYFEISNVFIEASGSTGACFMNNQGYSSSNNVDLHIKASNVRQIVGAFVTGNVFTTLFILTDSPSGLYTNNTFLIELHNFDIESPICMSRHLFNPNVSNVNNSVTYRGSNIIKRPRSVSTGIDAGFQKCIFSLPCTNAAITQANKPRVTFDFTNVTALNDSVFSDVQNQDNSFTYSGRTIIKGNYTTIAAEPVIFLRQAGSSAVLQDAILISGGTYSIDANTTGRLIYAKDVTSNVVANATNVTNQGETIIVDTDILNYL